MSGSTTSALAEPRRLLGPLALLLALGEVASAFVISFPIGAVIFAVLFLGAAVWVRRGGIGGAVFVAALCLFEVAEYPFWQRHSTAAVIGQSSFAAVALVTLLVAIATIWQTIAGRRAGAIVAGH